MTMIEHTITTPSIAELEAMLIQVSDEQLDARITVLISFLGCLGQHRTLELTYGCRFEVAIGDAGHCLPTAYCSNWTVGMGAALNGTGYRGQVKYVESVGTHTGGSAPAQRVHNLTGTYTWI